MLVLTRKIQEKIQIGENITVTILRVKGRMVGVGIEAPRDVRVMRAEVLAEAKAAVAEAVGVVTEEQKESVEVSESKHEETAKQSPAAPVAKPEIAEPMMKVEAVGLNRVAKIPANNSELADNQGDSLRIARRFRIIVPNKSSIGNN